MPRPPRTSCPGTCHAGLDGAPYQHAAAPQRRAAKIRRAGQRRVPALVGADRHVRVEMRAQRLVLDERNRDLRQGAAAATAETPNTTRKTAQKRKTNPAI